METGGFPSLGLPAALYDSYTRHNHGMTLERLSGVRYVVPLREGGSLPAVVETVREDTQTPGGVFVVKFQGAGQGAKALVAEALVAGLARVLAGC